MINGTGKQAIKNAVPTVTISFAGPSVFAAEARSLRFADPPKTPHSRVREGNRHSGAEMGCGGNGTLTLSSHNRSRRAVPRAVWLVLSRGKQAGRGHLIPWLRGSNSR